MQLLLLLLIIIIAGGVFRTYQLRHSKDQRAFLAGTFPDPLPDGFMFGSVKGWSGSWKGKTFHASTMSGINMFEDDGKTMEKYPFQTYKAKGLQDNEKDVLKIDYTLAANPWWVRPILDEIVQVGPGQYLGKMHVRFVPGLPFTALFFRLSKEATVPTPVVVTTPAPAPTPTPPAPAPAPDALVAQA